MSPTHIPPSNALYPVLDRTKLRTGFGQVPDFTLKLLRRAVEIAADEGKKGEIEKMALEVAELAPAFSDELVRELLTLSPGVAPALLANDNLGPEGAGAVEVYARRALLETPLAALDTRDNPSRTEAMLEDAARTLRQIRAAGHSWGAETRADLMGQVDEAERLAPNEEEGLAASRIQWATHALLGDHEDLTSGQLADVYGKTRRLLDREQTGEIAVHPAADLDLRLRVLEDDPAGAAPAICQDEELRMEPALRERLTSVHDMEVLRELLRDDVREELTPIMRTIMEMDAEAGLEMLEQPRFRALSRHHLSASALIPALTARKSRIRQRAIMIAGRLANDQREVGRDEIADAVEQAIRGRELY